MMVDIKLVSKNLRLWDSNIYIYIQCVIFSGCSNCWIVDHIKAVSHQPLLVARFQVLYIYRSWCGESCCLVYMFFFNGFQKSGWHGSWCQGMIQNRWPIGISFGMWDGSRAPRCKSHLPGSCLNRKRSSHFRCYVSFREGEVFFSRNPRDWENYKKLSWNPWWCRLQPGRGAYPIPYY